MQYFGGKNRIAVRIAGRIGTHTHQTYLEPFCGSFWVGSLIDAPTKIVIENNIPVDLINECIRAAIAAERDPSEIFRKLIEKAHAEANTRSAD